MATEQVRVVLTAQDNASVVVNNLTRSLGGLAEKISTGILQGVGQQIAQLPIQALAQGIQLVTGSIIDFNAHMEQSRLGWATMLGGAEQATVMLEQLSQFAERTPFDFPTVEQGARRLVAMGISAKDVIPTMTAIATAGAALGLSGEGINRITLALGQMQSKTKVSAEEMLQLTEAGIPGWDILARAMGKSTAEVQKLTSEGKITSATFINAFKGMYGEGSKFADLLNKQAETWQGATSNIRDALQRNLAKAFEPLFEGLRGLAVEIAKFVTSDQMTAWANRTKASIQALGITIQTLAADTNLQRFLIAVAAGIAAVAIAMNAQLVPAAAAATAAFIRMGIAFALANAPMILFAAAIAALAVVVVANWDAIGPVVEQVANFIGETLAELIAWLSGTAAPGMTEGMLGPWEQITTWLHDTWENLAKMWHDFWDLMFKDQAEGGGGLTKAFQDIWGALVRFFVWGIEKMAGAWNKFVEVVGQVPGFEFLQGKQIQLTDDQLKGLTNTLTDLSPKIGNVFSGLGSMITGIPGAIAKTVDLIKVVWQSVSNIDVGKLIDDILKALPSGPGSGADLAGQDIGKTLGTGITKAVKPLIEELAVLIARLLGLPVQEALEDTQYRVKEIDLMLALRGENRLPAEERIALRKERRELERNVLPPQELAAARTERGISIVTRPLTAAQLQQQIQQNILDQAKQAAEAAGGAVADAATGAVVTGAPTAAPGGAPTAVAPKPGVEPTKILLTINTTGEGAEATQIYEELFEANGQAITPPPIQFSAIRRR